MGFLPLGETFDLYAGVGIGYTMQSTTSNITFTRYDSQTLSQSGTGSVSAVCYPLSIGADWSLSKNFTLNYDLSLLVNSASSVTNLIDPSKTALALTPCKSSFNLKYYF